METFDPNMKKLLIQRMEERNKKGQLTPIYQLGQSFTPQQQINEAKKGSAIGDEFLMAEKRYMDELKRRMG